jgi:uncharacterized OsmC-like protein
MPSFQETYEAIKADITKGKKNFNVECVMLQDGMQCEIRMGAKPHTMLIDAPAGLDGTDVGPSPLLAILGSIGACLIAVTKFWSKIMNAQIDEMKVYSSGHINLGAIFGLAEDMLPGYDKVVPIVKIKSPESEETIKTLMDKVFTHCPVMTNFEGKSIITLVLKYKKSE